MNKPLQAYPVAETIHQPIVKLNGTDIAPVKSVSTMASALPELEKTDFETLVNCTDDLLWSVSGDLKLIAANNSFLQHISDLAGILLKPGDDILLHDLFPADSVANWQSCYNRALAGESFSEEMYIAAFGKHEESWTKTKFNPVYKGGQVVYIACNAENITHKKLTEEKIRQREARLTETQEIAKVGSWETDLINLNVVWSAETYRIFEMDPAAFQSSHPRFLDFVHPDDRAIVDEAFAKSITNSSINTIEHRIVTSKGNTKIVEERWRIYHDETGKPLRATGTCRDITEHKNAESAIQKAYTDNNSILESIDDGFFRIDNDSLVTYWNRRAEIMLGEKREGIIGKNLHEVFGANGSHVFYENYQKAIKEKITIHFEEYSKRSRKWLSVSAFGSDNGLSVYFKDVTEKKNAEEKLMESELRYRSLIEQATDTICIVDASFKFIEVNPAGIRMFEYSKEEMLQLTIPDVLFEEDLQTNPVKIEELKAGKTINNERKIKRKDGTGLDVELSGKMLEDGRIIIFGRDISERKKSEQLIKQSETKYRSFFESSMDGILLTVTDGEILAANPAACEIFGMTEAEIRARGRFGLADITDPRFKIMLTERQRTGKAKGEITLIRKDGSRFEAELTSAVFTDAYGKARTSMIVRDITERKKAEQSILESNERYNLISKATNDMVWDWDLGTGKVYRNREGWKKIFRTGEMVTENGSTAAWYGRIHPEDKEMVNLVSDQILKAEKDFFEVECRMQRDDGTYAYVHDRGHILRDNEGKAIRLIGATQDITARKEAELQVAKSEMRFRSLVQHSSDLIGILDERGYYMYSSPAVKKILGYDPEYIVGKNSFAFIHPDDINNIKLVLATMKAGINPVEVSFRFKNAKEAWRWLECKVTDMSNNPDVQGYIFNARDVTERKIAEEEINKLSIIARETVNAVVITDPEEKITWVNEAFTRITGFEPGEVMGKNPGDFLRGEETDPVVAQFIHDEIKKLRPFECDIINYTKSGRKFWMRIQSQPLFDETGKLKYFFSIETDITKEKEAAEILKASEERYRSLFNFNPASIIIWDIDNYKVLEVNNTALELYGFSREEFLAKTAFDISLSDDTDNIKQFALKARQKKDFRSEVSCCHINRSGEQMYMNISSHRIEYKGRPVILALATNITDKISLEKELEKERLLKQQEITEAVISAQEQERKELGTELHDNINQILAGSLLYLGLTKKELKIEIPHLKETEKLIGFAIDEIRNLSHALIQPSLKASEFSEELANIIAVTQKASGISISLQTSDFDESTIPEKLKLNIYRIVQEQFNNILKHAGAHHVVVRLVQDKEKTLLSIKDDGAGFDTTKKSKGVGLMNIKTRASLFNGEFHIISSPGKGCELKLLFN